MRAFSTRTVFGEGRVAAVLLIGLLATSGAKAQADTPSPVPVPGQTPSQSPSPAEPAPEAPPPPQDAPVAPIVEEPAAPVPAAPVLAAPVAVGPSAAPAASVVAEATPPATASSSPVGTGPRWGASPVEQTILILEQQRVEVRCQGRERLSCVVVSTQVLANPLDQPISVDLDLGEAATQISWEGGPLPVESSGTSPRARITLSGRSQGTLKATYQYRIALKQIQGTLARHPTLGQNQGDGDRADLSFRISRPELWGRVSRQEVSVSLPPGWKVREPEATPLHPGGSDSSSLRPCDATAKEKSALCEGRVPLLIERPGRHGLANGGPVIGMLIPSSGPVRARLGYEAGIGQIWVLNVLAGFASETQYQGNLLMVPTLTASAPRFGYVPAFALGMSAPVRVGHDTAVAFRAQLDIAQPIGPVSLLLSPSFEYFSVDKKATFLMGVHLAL